MLNHYFLLALRRLRRQKSYAALNVVGLAIGLAGALLVFQYVAYERSFDRFHDDGDALYRLTMTSERTGEAAETRAYLGYAFGPAVQQDVPGVEAVARLHPVWNAVVSDPERPERAFEETEGFYAEPEFLQLFSFPLLSGDPATALTEPGTVLISASAARRYFGERPALGQMLDLNVRREQRVVRVAGVFADVPAVSHLQFELLLPVADLLSSPMYVGEQAGWTWYNFFTYARLRPGTDPAEAGQAATETLLRRIGEDLEEEGETASLAFQPLRDVHLNSEVASHNVVAGSYRTVWFLTLIGAVMLLIALVNYVNLATARAAGRAREVGVRKAVGASRGRLVGQFLAESALTNGIALVLALALTAAAQPALSALAGAALPPAFWTQPAVWVAVAGIFVVGTLLAGLYPAAVLSAFQAAPALKGTAGGVGGHARMRQGLVVFQFAASVALVAGVLVVNGQLRYMRGLETGLDLSRVVVVPAPSVRPDGTDLDAAAETFREALAAVPGVQAVATSRSVPGTGYGFSTSRVLRVGADESAFIDGSLAEVDAGFVPLYGIEVVAGRAFSDEMRQQADGADRPMMASRSAAQALGYASAEDALGTRVVFGGLRGEVVGVFEDVRWDSAHEPAPNAFMMHTAAGEQVSIRVAQAGLPETLAAVEAAYGRLFPGNPYRATFAEAQYAAQYADDERFATLFALSAGLAIFIACLGLFGLAAFTAQQRTKEIGVRKVLGASVASLMLLLSKDFVRLVLLASALAAPLAWWTMSGWLDGFAARIDLGPGVFLLSGLLAVLIAVATVSAHALGTATADPVRALRSE